jgi:mono/diheme cytochrome c family protein
MLCIGVLVGLPGVAYAAAETIPALYVQHCAVCHGEKGDGQSRARYGLNPPPRDFTAPRAWDELSPERLRISILYGRPGTAMVAWQKKLSADQVDGLVDYIRTHFMRKPTASSDGARLYKKHCAACHGDKGNGAQWTQHSLNPSPRDFTAELAREELNRERMINSVTHGRPGTAMMSFSKRLSQQQIATIVDFIRSDFMQIGVAANPVDSAGQAAIPRRALADSPPADMTLAFPHGLVGQVERGRQFYMNNCFTCHRQQGQGDGPRSGFINPRPRNFITAESRRTLNRPALFRAIARGKQGTVMPAWATVLDNQQIVDVAEFVFQAFIQGQAIPAVNSVEEPVLKKKVLN